MGSLESVGFGFPQQGMPKLDKPAPPPQEAPAEELHQHQPNPEDEARIAALSNSGSFPAPFRAPVIQKDDGNHECMHESIHIGVCNGQSVNMRVNYKGEAEYNCDNAGWSKSPPLSFSKSRIRMSLDTLKQMGIDVKGYETSLGSYDSYSAPVSLLAEDDIDHSMGVLQTMHHERSQSLGRKSRVTNVNGPLFIANPEFENQFGLS